MDNKADYLDCLVKFTTEAKVTTKPAAIAYVDCYKKCYGFVKAEDAAGYKLMVTLTFVSMLIAFMAL